MKKMQCHVPKIILILFSVFCLSISPALSQISNYRLQQADSLFNAKQYTQSLDHYQKIFSQNQYSPSMLLKMAFIEEGLNQIGEALYHLNIYYLTTNDKSVLDKMEQLSQKHRLEGYENQEAEVALSIYRKYNLYISAGLTALLIFFFALTIFLKRRKRNFVPAFIGVALLAIIILVDLNYAQNQSQGIVIASRSYLMAGPSGAAPVVEIVRSGHRVEITGKKDIWVQVEWKGQTAYIKENLLLPIIL
jgi:hypothetical protein